MGICSFIPAGTGICSFIPSGTGICSIPAGTGICSLIPARTDRLCHPQDIPLVLGEAPGAPHSWQLPEELHPGLCWVCLGSSSSQLELEMLGGAAAAPSLRMQWWERGLGSVIPEDPISRGLFHALPHSLPGKRVLLPPAVEVVVSKNKKYFFKH